MDLDRIHIPLPSGPIKYKKRGGQHLKGRGKVDVSLRHSRFYMPIIRKWFNRLRWKPRQEGPNTPSNIVTLLECVIDIELFTGHCLEAVKGEVLSWAQKASRLTYYLKALVRTHTIAWNGFAVSYKQALRPTTDATSITPLGGPLMSGFCRKPIWTDERTPKVAAVNVWRAKQSYISQAGRSGITERRSRKFVHD